MPPPPRPGGRSRGADNRSSPSRRPGEGSGAIRRDRQRAAQGGPASSSRPSSRSAPRSPLSAQPGRPDASDTAHPEARRAGTRTPRLDSTGSAGYTPGRVGLLAVIVIILLVTVSFPLRNHYQFRSEERAVEQERIALERTIAELTEEQDRLDDPAFVEQQARIRFGAVPADETPYRVSPVDPEEVAAAQQAAEERAAQSWQTRLWRSLAEEPDPVVPPPDEPEQTEAEPLPEPVAPNTEQE